MKQGWDVPALLGVSSAYWRGCTVQAAVRLQIFTLIGDQKRQSVEIANQAGSDTRAMEMLLNALSGLGLLQKSSETYSNTEFSRKFLVESSPAYMGHIVLHHHHILDGWAQLDKAVITGEKVEKRSYGEEIERQSFLMGMFNLASGLAPLLADQIDLSSRKKLLDLGGGPGTYAIGFCHANSELQATILDRPTTEPFARQTVEKFNMTDRIDFIGGDFTVDPLDGGPYDVAWLSHILHSNSPVECDKCIKKVADVLEPGGMVIVHEFILNDAKDGPEFPALFSLNMLVGTDGGQSYSKSEISSMLDKAGFSSIEHRTFDSPNDSSLMIAIKKA